MKFLRDFKPQIDNSLVSYVTAQEKQLANVNVWAADAATRLKPFLIAGKTIRGSLVCFSYSLFHQPIAEEAIKAGAALELFHSGFLIHDDIMDQDTTRRNGPSLHIQYEKYATNAHTGVAMGINVGDLCFFLGYNLLPPSLTALTSQFLSQVTVAQMQDVFGAKTQDEILSLYRYKTATYSFALPMLLGATLAGAEKKDRDVLNELGEHMGMLFQATDDALPRSQESDRRNNKHTARTCMSQSEFHSFVAFHRDGAQVAIQRLTAGSLQKQQLQELVAYCVERKL